MPFSWVKETLFGRVGLKGVNGKPSTHAAGELMEACLQKPQGLLKVLPHRLDGCGSWKRVPFAFPTRWNRWNIWWLKERRGK